MTITSVAAAGARAGTVCAPRGFTRVGLADYENLGQYARRGRGFVEYWDPKTPETIRREQQLGSLARRITWRAAGVRRS